jgi:RNA polymerase sigma-70 factor (ECF subfamily)
VTGGRGELNRKEWTGTVSSSFAAMNVKPERVERRNLLFAEVAIQCRTRLLLRAHRITACREEAEDIVQEVYLKALKGLSRFRGDSKMDTWLYSIMKNASLEYLRNRKRRGLDQQASLRPEDDGQSVLEVRDTRTDPEEACARSEIEELLLSEIDKLDSVCKRTLQMCLLEEVPYQTAAKSLQVRVTTIKSRVFRGRRMLRKALSPGFVSNPAQRRSGTDRSEEL